MSPFDPAWTVPQPDYADAIHAAAFLAIDPAGLGGMQLRGLSGPARDEFVQVLSCLFPSGTPVKKIPLNISDDRLIGGLDLAASLHAGKPVYGIGLLAEAQHGILVLAMAERQTAAVAARISAALDGGANPAIIALDEGLVDEAPPPNLLERLAFTVAALPGKAPWPGAADISAARQTLKNIVTSDDALAQICTAATVLGVDSLRALLFTLRAARAAAALRGAAQTEAADIALAVTLVLLPRATRQPSADELPPAPPPDEQTSETRATQSATALEETVQDATQATLPSKLLAVLQDFATPRRVARGSGQSGARRNLRRGRPASARPGPLAGDARLSLLETLRAAAPWQRLRQRRPSQKIAVRREDFRLKNFKEQPRRVTIFAVDASGSSALNRLAEAKGAIQLLLAECYVRRDEAALIAFRRQGAEILLPPTHALARARRALAALPGGGATPLSHGITAARLLAQAEQKKGREPLVVLLTDGGANIGQDGKAGRAAAAADALAAAKACRGIAALVVDISPRRHALAQQISAAMAARYLALPYADAAGLSLAVQALGGAHASSAT